jgi:hypothetical protein
MPVLNKPMTESNARDLFPGALEMMILESLRRQPAHGYALVQHIQQRSNNLLQVEEGSLYPALQRRSGASLPPIAASGPIKSPLRVCAISNSRFPALSVCLKAFRWS